MRLGSKPRSDRAESVRRKPHHELDILEGRQLLSADPFRYYHTPILPPVVGRGRGPIYNYLSHPVRSVSQHRLATLDNEGKEVRGKDREGDEYVIKVHGPGAVIVTDATPNDGVLDDDLWSIQLVGTDPRRTQVVGQVIASARVVSDGTILFQKLSALEGVHSIKLNGFTLTQTLEPVEGQPNYSDTGIFLYGGVGLLQFHNIEATFDVVADNDPIRIIIGNPSTPLRHPPAIRLDSIFNTVINSALAAQPPNVPQTQPTVRIEVNGELRGLDMISSTAQPVIAGRQAQFPPTAITGRTSVRATAMRSIKVNGTARNVTFSKGEIPARNAFVGMDRLGTAKFGGNADGVGIFVAGPIHRVTFMRGLGNPTGYITADTQLGTPVGEYGYPAYGLLGGVITATSIDGIAAGPANVIQQHSMDPDQIQLQETNATTYYPRPGAALTSVVIATERSIRHVSVLGNFLSTEIKTGFDYTSYIVGLEGTRAASRIAALNQSGDLIDSVNSATYRPVDGIYGNGNDLAGNGSISGHQDGFVYVNGAETALKNLGSGNYSRIKRGYLPPPEGPRRIQGVLRRV